MKFLKPACMIFLSLWITGFLFSHVSAMPLVSLPEQTIAAPGETIIIPIALSNLTSDGITIDGYAMKIDFDDTILLNPEVVSENTLSAGNSNLMAGPSEDGIGKFTVAVFNNLKADTDGTLVKLKFDIADSATGSYTLNFKKINSKSILFKGGFEQTDAEFKEGQVVIKSNSSTTVSVSSDIKAIAGDKVIVAYELNNVKETVDGYALKIDYDDTLLLNPVVISDDTLSQGNANIMQGPSSDGIGKFTIAVFQGLNASNDGTLIKLQFDVAAKATGEIPVSFQKKNVKTILFKSGFENITEVEWIDGKVTILPPDGPIVSVAADIQVLECQTIVIVPFEITDIPANMMIEGFALKLDYADYLTNPQVITEGTLSEGNEDVIVGPSEDNIGKYTVSVFSGLKANQSGTLIKVQFDVRSDFVYPMQTPVEMKSKNDKTMVYAGNFDNVQAEFKDGLITASKCKRTYAVSVPVTFDDASHYNGDVIVDIYRAASSQLYTTQTFSMNDDTSYTLAVDLPDDNYILQIYAENNQANAHRLTATVAGTDVTIDPIVITTQSQAGAAIDLNIDTRNYDSGVSMTDIETILAVEQNNTFRLAIVGQNVSNLDTPNIDLLFEPDKVAFLQGKEDDPMIGVRNLLKQNGGSTSGFVAVETNPGMINIANTLTGFDESQAPEGSGILALIEFKVLNASEPASFTLSNVIFSNSKREEENISLLSQASINTCPKWDINCDCITDYKDLQIMGDHWPFKEGDPYWNPDVNISKEPDFVSGKQIINVWDLKVLGDHWLENWCLEQ
jgi:hypothetical protein